MNEAETAGAIAGRHSGELVYRQKLLTRLTHWIWAICLFFLLLSGLQIFNAHPSLYVGQQSGFEFDNAILSMGSVLQSGERSGYTEIFGTRYDTTGLLGYSGAEGERQVRGFPAWATIPSIRDLATGRVVHFFFAWLFLATILVWFLASLFNGHLRRDLSFGSNSLRQLPRDVIDHLKLRFVHGRTYSPLQRLTYAGVLFVLFPLIVITGLAMSPGANASVPWLLDVLGGRQTARTIHFTVMLLLVIFFIVHILMVVLAGPINEMGSMITGWYRTSPPIRTTENDHG